MFPLVFRPIIRTVVYKFTAFLKILLHFLLNPPGTIKGSEPLLKSVLSSYTKLNNICSIDHALFTIKLKCPKAV